MLRTDVADGTAVFASVVCTNAAGFQMAICYLLLTTYYLLLTTYYLLLTYY